MPTAEVTQVSARLQRAAGIMAGRLAHFLSTSLPQAEGEMANSQSFLWAMYEAVAEGCQLKAWQAGLLEPTPDGSLHPIDRLVRALKLSPVEVELMLLAGLSEEHEGYAAILRSLHPRSESRASSGLAAQLFCRNPDERRSFRELLEVSAVARSGVLRVAGDGSFFERSLHLADALWSALHGINVWPAAVTRLEREIRLAGLEEWLSTAEAQRAAAAIRRGEACTVLVNADHEDTAFHRACALAAHASAEPVGILLASSPETGVEKLIQVHALAHGVTPVIKLASVEGPVMAEFPSFADFPAPVIACGRSGAITVGGGRPLIPVRADRLSPAARQRMWRETMPELATEAAFLAARYPVEPQVAAAAASDTRFISELEGRDPVVDDLAVSLRARGSTSLSAGVKLVRPQASWEDLVLSADRLKQLHEAARRLELQMLVYDEWGFLRGRRGARGVRMLFSGPPGTGKTLSAEVIAQALEVDLLVVDLARIVSKWIGETEKNLAAVFDAAERAQAALFFDEADALFGKRTEVTDAHDRYANLETAYLLTRLEEFEGLAILATNLRQNIDPAFVRRLEFVVDFDEPGSAERLAIWRCHLPPAAPLSPAVNLPELAAFYPVTGGMIRNAAVAAGFLAAGEGQAIDRQHLVRAIRREYEKAGRAFPGVPLGMTM